MSIVVRTLSERVFEIVRERIITGEIATDQPIRQDALAAELGVSKIPLREALGRLEQEGLLISHANRGYLVRTMSYGEAEEIFALRLAIEPPVATLAAEHATEADRDRAMEAYRQLDAAATNDLPGVAIRNRDFHTAMVHPAERRLTTQLVERLTIMAERYVIAHLQPAGRDARAHLEHKGLIDAWLDRDGETLARLLTNHIQGTLDDLKEQLTGPAA